MMSWLSKKLRIWFGSEEGKRDLREAVYSLLGQVMGEQMTSEEVISEFIRRMDQWESYYVVSYGRMFVVEGSNLDCQTERLINSVMEEKPFKRVEDGLKKMRDEVDKLMMVKRCMKCKGFNYSGCGWAYDMFKGDCKHFKEV